MGQTSYVFQAVQKPSHVALGAPGEHAEKSARWHGGSMSRALDTGRSGDEQTAHLRCFSGKHCLPESALPPPQPKGAWPAENGRWNAVRSKHVPCGTCGGHFHAASSASHDIPYRGAANSLPDTQLANAATRGGFWTAWFTLIILGMLGHVHAETPCKDQQKIQHCGKSEQTRKPLAELPATPQLQPRALAHLEKVMPSLVPDWLPKDLKAPSVVSENEGVEDISLNFQAVVPRTIEKATDPGQPEMPYTPADPNNLDLLWPVDTRTVSAGFGLRTRTKTVLKRAKSHKKLRKVKVPYRGRHRGVDLRSPMGEDVFAALPGEVLESGRRKGYGNYVLIDHGNGITTLYAHHSINYVMPGEIVKRGQKIAEVGMTGRTTGPHLHFELHLQGRHQDPLPYLNEEEPIPGSLVAQNQAAVPPKRFLR